MNADDVIEHELTGRNGAFRVIVGADSTMWGPVCAVIYGQPKDDCLVRVHSRCLYGEIFESEDCDCRRQLRESIRLIRRSGSGIVIYLEQEGRGSGLVAKARGYVYAQKEKVDTFSSYAALNLPADSRTYEAAAAILKHLNITKIRLLTNNPSKINELKRADIEVTPQQLLVPVAEKAWEYLMAKRRRQGHDIPESLKVRVKIRRTLWRRKSGERTGAKKLAGAS